MDLFSEEFKKRFPHLAREFEEKAMNVEIDAMRTVDEKAASEKLRGYSPGVMDFLRRCNDVDEAEKVIEFLEKRDEVSDEEANKLRAQLREKGLRSFGPKKEHGHYFRGDV